MLLLPVLSLSLSSRPLSLPRPLGSAAHRAKPVVITMSHPEPGKFVRHNELSPGCGPLGVLCGGFQEEQLEVIAEALESVFDSPDGQVAQVPIVALAQSDMRLRLRDVLAKLSERDSVLPDQPMRLRTPLVLLSGFSPVQTSLAVRQIRSLGLQGRSQPERFRWPWESDDADDAGWVAPMFAAAVPKALDKPLSVLCEELEGDQQANAARG